MPLYVDAFVLPIPTKNMAAYKKMSRAASRVWMEHGALEYRECAGDDLKSECGVPFPKLAKTRQGETVVFSWIVYKSKADRNRVNRLVMADPRLAKMMTSGVMPFDMKRMAYGGFKTIVVG